MGRTKKEDNADISAPESGVAVVTWRLGTREYSKDVHGEDYKKLAKEFADKVGGTIS